MSDNFIIFRLIFPDNLYNQLLKSVDFDDITSGRKGATLVDYKNNLIPLVRATTSYIKLNQKFLPIHYQIIDNIKRTTKNDKLEFNNALIKLYETKYFKMGFHSDLNENSYMCVLML